MYCLWLIDVGSESKCFQYFCRPCKTPGSSFCGKTMSTFVNSSFLWTTFDSVRMRCAIMSSSNLNFLPMRLDLKLFITFGTSLTSAYLSQYRHLFVSWVESQSADSISQVNLAKFANLVKSDSSRSG